MKALHRLADLCDEHGERGKGTTLLNMGREIVSMRVAAMQRRATENDNGTTNQPGNK